MKTYDLAIIGAGPAGMAAAIEAVKWGLRPLVLDENAQPGGRLLATPPSALRQRIIAHRQPREGDRLLREFARTRSEIDYLPGCTVVGFFDKNTLAYVEGGRLHQCGYRALIVAAGAYDRPVPFPGWTLPGVVTAGGTLNLIKQQGVLPGRRILLAGSGPLLLTLAARILRAHGALSVIAEASRPGLRHVLPMLASVPGNAGSIIQGLCYAWVIRKNRVPVWRGHVVSRVDGDRKVQEATLSRVDSEWRPVPGATFRVPVDTVCLAYGLVPSTEALRLLGCDHRYDLRLGGWYPVRDEHLHTSHAGVFAAGDCAGISGGAIAMVEGRLAAVAACAWLGRILASRAEIKYGQLLPRLRAKKRFAALVQNTCYPRSGLFSLADENTVVCRCEDLTLRDVRAAVSNRMGDINAFKRATRSGMGRCQGRMCGPYMQELLAASRGIPPHDLGALQVRPPLKPVELGSFREG